MMFLNPIQMRGGKAPLPTSFSPITFFSQAQIIELKLRPPRLQKKKKWFFWSNAYKIEVMITSLIEVEQLQIFGHMATSTSHSRDIILLVTSWREIMAS